MTKGKHAALADALPFWSCEEDGVMAYADGSLGCAFDLQGVDIGSVENSTINDIASKLEGILCHAPEGIKIQFFYRLCPKDDLLLKQHGNLSKNAPVNYEPLRKSRLDFFKRQEFFIPKISVFIKSGPISFSRWGWWQGKKSFEKISRGEFESQKHNFLKIKKRIKSAFSRVGLNPKELTRNEWFSLVFEHFNRERSEKIGIPTLKEGIFSDSFSSQAVLTDLIVHRDCLQVGKMFFRIVSLSSLPEGESYAAMIDDFLANIPFHFGFSQCIEIPSQKTEMDKLGLQRRLANSLASGAQGVRDLESESKLKHTEELMGELLEGGRRIVVSDFNVLLWAYSRDELDEKSDTVLQTFRAMGGSEGVVETLPLFNAFIACSPGACELFRPKKLKSDNCSHLIPVYAQWDGNTTPVCLFKNREGGILKFDPFAAELPSWNALIFAASGSGKSFNVIQMALQFYGQHPTPRIVWIDNGASSERVLDKSILDGQFIDLGLESSIRVNMFDLPEGEKTPGPSKTKLILAILERILAEDDTKGLPKRHKSLLEEAIHQVYENSESVPVLSDLKKILDNHEAKEMRDYGKILFSWTGSRAYGRLLDGPTNIDLKKDLITIEIKGLDTYPDLQNAMLLNFLEFIKSKAAGDSSRPTLLVIDEAWKLLETPSGKSFTIEAYRTFRKFGSGIWAISQNYKDFLRDEEISNALYPNTSSVLILAQNKIDWKDFAKRLQLNQAEVEAVKSLESVKGKYAEAFLMQDTNRAILRIESDPLSYWVATTDPKDKAEIAKMERENPKMDKLEILKQLSKKKEN